VLVELVEPLLLPFLVAIQHMEWFLLVAVAVVEVQLLAPPQDLAALVAVAAEEVLQESQVRFLIWVHLLAQVQVELGIAQVVEMELLEQVRLEARE
jgi:hypothetical protein